MKIDEKILKRLNKLYTLGEEVIATRKGNNDPYDVVDNQLAFQWRTSVQNLLVKVFGNESEHYKNFLKQFEKHVRFFSVDCAQGVLKAAIDDYQSGQLFDVKRVIEADLFDDFLEQASHLFELGYYQPSAVIAGCVLEDRLRKLCVENDIDLSEKTKLNSMNSKLAEKGVYTKLIQKKIIFLSDLRNKAAHGQWDKFSKGDVGEMIQGIRRLLEDWA